MPGARHGHEERFGERLHRVGNVRAAEVLGELAEVEADVAVVGGGVEFEAPHVRRTRLFGKVVERGEELDLVAHLVGGNGVSERRGSLDVQIGSLRHHPPEQRDVEAVFGRIERFFRELRQLLVVELRGVELLFGGVLRVGARLRFAEKEERVVAERGGDFLSTRLRFFLIRAERDAGFGEVGREVFGFALFASDAECHAEIVHFEAHLALPALRADAGAGRAADHRGFRSANVVAVQAGDRKGLEDVELDALACIRLDFKNLKTREAVYELLFDKKS